MMDTICKDVIEAHWLEYLSFLKQHREAQKKLAEQIRVLQAGPPTPILLGGTPSFDDYYADINSFWNWYVDYKVEVKE